MNLIVEKKEIKTFNKFLTNVFIKILEFEILIF
jgi:hypothetical protein